MDPAVSLLSDSTGGILMMNLSMRNYLCVLIHVVEIILFGASTAVDQVSTVKDSK